MKRTVVGIRDFRLPAVTMLALAALWPLIARHVSVPCPLRTLTGIPCPLCGMTTSVVATTRGRFAEAAAANPAGLLAVLVAVWLTVSRRESLAIPRLAIGGSLLAMWIFELFRFEVL